MLHGVMEVRKKFDTNLDLWVCHKMWVEVYDLSRQISITTCIPSFQSSKNYIGDLTSQSSSSAGWFFPTFRIDASKSKTIHGWELLHNTTPPGKSDLLNHRPGIGSLRKPHDTKTRSDYMLRILEKMFSNMLCTPAPWHRPQRSKPGIRMAYEFWDGQSDSKRGLPGISFAWKAVGIGSYWNYLENHGSLVTI